MKIKKYYRINEQGKMEYSDTRDENLGFVGETLRDDPNSMPIRFTPGSGGVGLTRARGVGYVDADGKSLSTCPYVPHRYGPDQDFCDGLVHEEFDHHSLCEYEAMSEKAYATYDGVALRSARHPWSWKWWFKSLMNFFRRPKFSAASLEPAEELKDCTCDICEKKKYLDMFKNCINLFGSESINYESPKLKKYAKWLKENQ